MPNKLKDNIGIKPELRDALVMPKQANSVAADIPTLLADFNALLTKLRAAGILDS
jgi:hypothetical protein